MSTGIRQVVHWAFEFLRLLNSRLEIFSVFLSAIDINFSLVLGSVHAIGWLISPGHQ